MDDVANYWKHVAMTSAQQHEQIIQAQRDEIEALQRRCQELLYECTMMKASNAMDFRDFCVANASPSGQVPLSYIVSFLNCASDGLVPPLENKRKRQRERGVPPSPVSRAVQRLLFLNRTLVREGDVEECDRSQQPNLAAK
jgi:hypothetical protein